jgi:hypothetical protein
MIQCSCLRRTRFIDRIHPSHSERGGSVYRAWINACACACTVGARMGVDRARRRSQGEGRGVNNLQSRDSREKPQERGAAEICVPEETKQHAGKEDNEDECRSEAKDPDARQTTQQISLVSMRTCSGRRIRARRRPVYLRSAKHTTMYSRAPGTPCGRCTVPGHARCPQER